MNVLMSKYTVKFCLLTTLTTLTAVAGSFNTTRIIMTTPRPVTKVLAGSKNGRTVAARRASAVWSTALERAGRGARAQHDLEREFRLMRIPADCLLEGSWLQC